MPIYENSACGVRIETFEKYVVINGIALPYGSWSSARLTGYISYQLNDENDLALIFTRNKVPDVFSPSFLVSNGGLFYAGIYSDLGITDHQGILVPYSTLITTGIYPIDYVNAKEVVENRCADLVKCFTQPPTQAPVAPIAALSASLPEIVDSSSKLDDATSVPDITAATKKRRSRRKNQPMTPGSVAQTKPIMTSYTPTPASSYSSPWIVVGPDGSKRVTDEVGTDSIVTGFAELTILRGNNVAVSNNDDEALINEIEETKSSPAPKAKSKRVAQRKAMPAMQIQAEAARLRSEESKKIAESCILREGIEKVLLKPDTTTQNHITSKLKELVARDIFELYACALDHEQLINKSFFRELERKVLNNYKKNSLLCISHLKAIEKGWVKAVEILNSKSISMNIASAEMQILLHSVIESKNHTIVKSYLRYNLCTKDAYLLATYADEEIIDLFCKDVEKYIPMLLGLYMNNRTELFKYTVDKLKILIGKSERFDFFTLYSHAVRVLSECNIPENDKFLFLRNLRKYNCLSNNYETSNYEYLIEKIIKSDEIRSKTPKEFMIYLERRRAETRKTNLECFAKSQEDVPMLEKLIINLLNDPNTVIPYGRHDQLYLIISKLVQRDPPISKISDLTQAEKDILNCQFKTWYAHPQPKPSSKPITVQVEIGNLETLFTHNILEFCETFEKQKHDITEEDLFSLYAYILQVKLSTKSSKMQDAFNLVESEIKTRNTYGLLRYSHIRALENKWDKVCKYLLERYVCSDFLIGDHNMMHFVVNTGQESFVDLYNRYGVQFDDVLPMLRFVSAEKCLEFCKSPNSLTVALVFFHNTNTDLFNACCQKIYERKCLYPDFDYLKFISNILKYASAIEGVDQHKLIVDLIDCGVIKLFYTIEYVDPKLPWFARMLPSNIESRDVLLIDSIKNDPRILGKLGEKLVEYIQMRTVAGFRTPDLGIRPQLRDISISSAKSDVGSVDIEETKSDTASRDRPWRERTSGDRGARSASPHPVALIEPSHTPTSWSEQSLHRHPGASETSDRIQGQHVRR